LDSCGLLFCRPSLTRGRVYNLLLLLVLASAFAVGFALFEERSGLSFVSISLYSVTMYIRYLHKIFILSVIDTVKECMYNNTRLLSV
jgi:hypothetical protein